MGPQDGTLAKGGVRRFPRPWEARTSLNEKGPLGSRARLVRMGMWEEEGHKGGKEAAPGFPSTAALSSPAKPITMRGTDLWTLWAKNDERNSPRKYKNFMKMLEIPQYK